MRFLIQRVKSASVSVENQVIGKIDTGFLVLIGITHTDTKETADKMVRKLTGLRIFADENGKTNKSLADIGGGLLLISQFTLYANCRHGNRPDFLSSAAPGPANELYEYIIAACKKAVLTVETGRFGADMAVSLVNDGPFTVMLDSEDLS